jgi:hypothetical protein
MTPMISQLLANVERPPVTVDTKGACDLVEEIEEQRPSEQTLRRWPIRYKIIGRKRRYKPDDIITHSRKRYEQAPVRIAARSRHSV